LVPFIGAEEAKELGAVFFVPWGGVILLITGFMAISYGRQALVSIRTRESPRVEATKPAP
jgi:hypothetical protein